MNFLAKIIPPHYLNKLNFNLASNVLLLLIALLIALSFKQYGASNDELVQHTYGQLLVKFYASAGQDLSAFSYKNLYLYGGFFDLLAAGLEPYSPWLVWDLRHLLAALFGLAGIIAVQRSTLLLAGPRAAFFSALLLSLCGAWSGAMFTHTKDVTFAACMAWALYFTILIARDLSHIRLRHSLLLGLAIGLSIGLRIGGAFAVIYLLLVLLLALTQTGSRRAAWQLAGAAIRGLLPAALLALLVTAICWPWVVMGINHIVIAAQSFSHFAFNMNTIVAGKWVNISDISAAYLFQYLLIRLPELFLAGLLLALLFSLQSLMRGLAVWRTAKALQINLPLAALIISSVFPLLFVLLDKPVLYNGIRHFTFILPPLAICAALALDKGLSMCKAKPICYASMAALIILSASYTTSLLWRLHPYQYTFYNALAGDYKSAQTRWEADYWSSSSLQAARLLQQYIANEGAAAPAQPYQVAICAEAFQGQAYLDDRFVITENWRTADFFISTTHMNCHTVLQGKLVGEINRLGATLAVVKDRRALQGEQRTPRPAQQP